MRELRLLPVTLVLLALLWAPSPGAGATSPSGPDDVRIGISFGGISFVGLIMEYRWGDTSLDINVGTWSFRDLSVSVVAKQYFGPGALRPFSGLGLWMVAAPFHPPDEQAGVALVLRAPVGAEWTVADDHHLGSSLSLNRALWIRRKDPADETPPSDRIIPLPGFYYRWKGN
jgi:hypothetical protein